MKLTEDLEKSLQALRRGHRRQRQLATVLKNKVLSELAGNLEKNSDTVLTENQKDLQSLDSQTTPAFRDRLTLNPQRIAGMAESLRQVGRLPDPVGEVVEQKTLQNGLQVRRVRSPLGVILMIFEARPNVILEAFSLAFKSGNSIVLRGGSDSKWTSRAIYQILRDTLAAHQLQETSFYGIEDYDRGLVETMLQRKDLFDIVVPRGGDKLIEFVQKTSLMPIIKNDRGLCHTYVDEDADLKMAVEIVKNAKVQRPGVCNSLETVLVHRACAPEFLSKLYESTDSSQLRWKADPASIQILSGKPRVQAASDQDWDTEHLDLILNCRVVDSFEQALQHIELHGSKHSEAIVTRSESKARRFQEEVDAAAVYWNASTRFTDGFELGLGGELGISTQKLHVRGPVGLRELTTPRWIIDGTGQIRG